MKFLLNLDVVMTAVIFSLECFVQIDCQAFNGGLVMYFEVYLRSLLFRLILLHWLLA